MIQSSAPYSLEKNGKAERAGRTLVTLARSLHIEACLPEDLWPEMMKTATYHVNQISMKGLKWKTPIGVVRETLGLKPQISLANLRILACKSFVKNHKIKKGLIKQPTAFIGLLVGFEGNNIWRVWLREHNRVVCIRDVVFDESQKFNPKDEPLTSKLSAEIAERLETVELPESNVLETFEIEDDKP